MCHLFTTTGQPKLDVPTHTHHNIIYFIHQPATRSTAEKSRGLDARAWCMSVCMFVCVCICIPTCMCMHIPVSELPAS